MAWQQPIRAAVRSLQREEAELKKQLERVRENLSALERIQSGRNAAPARSGKRRLSPKGRDAISRAAKKRWREYRAQKAKGQS